MQQAERQLLKPPRLLPHNTNPQVGGRLPDLPHLPALQLPGDIPAHDAPAHGRGGHRGQGMLGLHGLVGIQGLLGGGGYG